MRPREITAEPSEHEAIHKLLDTMIYTLVPQMQAAYDRIAEAKGVDVAESLVLTNRSDITGEINYVIAALCLINSKNCVDMIGSDLGRINKARAKARKQPLVSYSTVALKLSKADERTAAASGMTKAQIRQHIVRGHFKIRSTGVYWWRPHIRGASDVGEVRRAGYSVMA